MIIMGDIVSFKNTSAFMGGIKFKVPVWLGVALGITLDINDDLEHGVPIVTNPSIEIMPFCKYYWVPRDVYGY